MEIKAETLKQQMPNLSVSDPARLQQISQISDARERAEMVAGQLEGLFMNMMVKAMRETVPKGGLIGEGLGGDMYREMLDRHYVEAGGGPVDPAMHEALVRELMQKPNAGQEALQALNNTPHPLQTQGNVPGVSNPEEGGTGKTSGF